VGDLQARVSEVRSRLMGQRHFESGTTVLFSLLTNQEERWREDSSQRPEVDSRLSEEDKR
jgi:hypothetical protein